MHKTAPTGEQVRWISSKPQHHCPTAGVRSARVVAVATVGAQTAGTGAIGRLAPRPLLVLHGTADPILSDRCARDLYARAAEPKELGLYAGDGHGLEHHQTDVLDRLVAWTIGVLQAAG